MRELFISPRRIRKRGPGVWYRFYISQGGINMHRSPFQGFLGLISLIAIAGCYVTTHDKGNGKKDDVDIRTPFGSVRVKEGGSDIKDTGLSLYPGARQKTDSDDERH